MKKLLIILAFVALGALPASAQKLRLMSYNIHNGWGVDGVNSIARIGDVVTKFAPDVVAVQEVDSMTRRNKRYLMGVLGEQTGYHAYFMRTIPHTGGGYGIGMLSKEKALSVQRIPLPCRSEPRGFLLVEFEKYYFACTHLSLHEEDRVTSIGIIVDELSKLDKPVMIAGDFNARPNSEPMRLMGEHFQVFKKTEGNGFTIRADKPHAEIDYICLFTDKGAKAEVKSHTVISAPVESDHLPIVAEVVITE